MSQRAAGPRGLGPRGRAGPRSLKEKPRVCLGGAETFLFRDCLLRGCAAFATSVRAGLGRFL